MALPEIRISKDHHKQKTKASNLVLLKIKGLFHILELQSPLPNQVENSVRLSILPVKTFRTYFNLKNLMMLMT